MTLLSSIVLYLEKHPDTTLIQEYFKKTSGCVIVSASEYGQSEDVFAYYSIDTHAGEFPVGVELTWENAMVPIEQIFEYTKGLACRLNCQVLTDLPSSHSRYADPIYWCLIMPNGRVLEILEDDTDDSEFLLDWSSVAELITDSDDR